MTNQAVSSENSAGGLPASAGRVFLEILIHGPLSRVELAQRLDLSGPSLTRLTKPLLASGRLTEGPPRIQAAGRPLQPLDIDPSAERFAGVKLTADSVHVVITDMRGQVLVSATEPLPDREPHAVARTVAATVTGTAGGYEPLAGVGLSLGGRTADGRVVGEANFLGWRDVPLADLLEAELGLPAVLSNDVNALARSQHWFGEGRGLSSFAVITIGAGVGLGAVVNGEIAEGSHGGAGSIGHQLLRPSEATCWRGHHGCANALLSTTSIETAAASAGSPLGYDDILRGAERGDPVLRRVVDDAGSALGILIATVANAFDPQRIIVSGEGALLGRVGEHSMLRAYADAKAWVDTETSIEVQPFEFYEWARGAATAAIQKRVLSPEYLE